MTQAGAFAVSLPFCGLPCPPALLTFEGDRLAGAEGACAVCRREAQAARTTQARIGGREAALHEALDRAAGILAESRRPFVYGLASSPVGTARLAARLAARLDAAVDIEGAEAIEPEIGAIAETGQVMATFGEVRAAADVVVLWRIDPRASHPDLLPETRPNLLQEATDGGARRFVVVPPGRQRGSDPPVPGRAGDLVLPIPAGGDLEALQRLRHLLRHAPAGGGEPGPGDPVHAAAAVLAAARRVAIFWDGAIAAQAPDGKAIAAGFALLTLQARSRPRIAAKALGAIGHVAGAMAGLLQATGFPGAVGFAAGRPRRDPDRFSAARLLGAGGADCVLAIEPLAPERLATRPTILIGSRLPAPPFEPDVLLPVRPAALHGEGLWLRADGVPIRRRAPGTDPAGPSPAAPSSAAPPAGAPPSEAAILAALLDRLKAAA